MAEDRPESSSMFWELKISFEAAWPLDTDKGSPLYPLLARSSQSIKTGIDLSIKIGKTDLIDIDFIDQSVEIDDTLVSFIDLSWSSWRN